MGGLTTPAKMRVYLCELNPRILKCVSVLRTKAMWVCVLGKFAHKDDAAMCAVRLGGELAAPMFGGTEWYPILCVNRSLCQYQRWTCGVLYVVFQVYEEKDMGEVDFEIEWAGNRWLWLRGDPCFDGNDDMMMPWNAHRGSDLLDWSQSKWRLSGKKSKR